MGKTSLFHKLKSWIHKILEFFLLFNVREKDLKYIRTLIEIVVTFQTLEFNIVEQGTTYNNAVFYDI